VIRIARCRTREHKHSSSLRHVVALRKIGRSISESGATITPQRRHLLNSSRRAEQDRRIAVSAWSFIVPFKHHSKGRRHIPRQRHRRRLTTCRAACPNEPPR
jgi:hypothetical protein